jgi:hypothetical protein
MAITGTVSADWQRLELSLNGAGHSLTQAEVLALHTVTSEALALLAQTMEPSRGMLCEACAEPHAGSGICPECVESARSGERFLH